jgi:Tfp pilus assembly protein PilO
MTFWFLQASEILAWVSAIILFVIGVIYIALHCGYNKELKEEYEKEEAKGQKEKEKANAEETPIRENLI